MSLYCEDDFTVRKAECEKVSAIFIFLFNNQTDVRKISLFFLFESLLLWLSLANIEGVSVFDIHEKIVQCVLVTLKHKWGECATPWIIITNDKHDILFSIEATCITEMSVLMACWKQNNFLDGLCSNEVKDFYICVEKAQVCPHTKQNNQQLNCFVLLNIHIHIHIHALCLTLAVTNHLPLSQAAMKNKSEQTKMQGGRLHPKQATTLLKRFPNPRTEI